MAASANPLATEAGREILRAGGSAVDAAIAIQMVLTLVEPQSSGVGGGAFLMHWDGRKVIAYDGRETAPMAADEKLFLLPDGKAMAFYDAVVGGRSVGTPGAVRMLEVAHKQYGKLPWARLFEPAIRLADAGFPMSPRLNMQLAAEKYLKNRSRCGSLFLRVRWHAEARRHDDAQSGAGGHAARTCGQSERLVCRRNSGRHRQGGQRAPERRAAWLSVTSLRIRSNNANRSAPTTNNGVSAVFLRPPLAASPSRRCSAILSARNIAASPPAGAMGPAGKLELSSDAVHLFSEAGRLAFADRGLYVADSDFVKVNVAGLLDPAI